MTTYSRSELATRVLKDLGLVGAEETPSAADSTWAQETIATVTAQLAAEGIPIWGGSDSMLPEAYLAALSKRIGLDVGPSFGLFSIAEAETAKPLVNTTLRRMSAKQPTGAVLAAEYF